MEFEQLLLLAKCGDDEAFEKIYRMYRPLLLKNAIGKEGLDEDLYQELCKILFLCIQKFQI